VVGVGDSTVSSVGNGAVGAVSDPSTGPAAAVAVVGVDGGVEAAAGRGGVL